jgi:hypothetical protein
MFDVKKNLKGDMNAARLLNISDESYYGALERVSNREVNAIEDNIFNPYDISIDIKNAFADNAAKLSMANPFDAAADAIASLESQFADINLNLPEFPFFENPLMPIMQDTPLTPTSLGLPQINAESVSAQVQGGNFTNLTNKQKFDLLFPNG